MNTGATAVFDPVHKLLKSHPAFQLQSFGAFVEGYDSVPGIPHEPEFKITLELFPSDLVPAFSGQHEVERFQNSIFTAAIMCPVIFHQLFIFPKIQMGSDGFSQYRPDAGRPGLGDLDEDAFMLV